VLGTCGASSETELCSVYVMCWVPVVLGVRLSCVAWYVLYRVPVVLASETKLCTSVVVCTCYPTGDCVVLYTVMLAVRTVLYNYGLGKIIVM
jgi:hypothetical protein